MIAQKWFPVNAEQGQQSRKILGHTISYHHTIIVDHCCKMWISMNRPYAPPMPLWHLRAVACGMTNWHFQQVSPFNSSQCGLELLSLASTCLISEMHWSTTMKLNYAKTNFRFQFNSSMCLYVWYFDIVLIDLEISWDFQPTESLHVGNNLFCILVVGLYFAVEMQKCNAFAWAPCGCVRRFLTTKAMWWWLCCDEIVHKSSGSCDSCSTISSAFIAHFGAGSSSYTRCIDWCRLYVQRCHWVQPCS